MKELEFGTSYDITEIATKKESYKQYKKVYIFVDTLDYHIFTIQENINKRYAYEKGVYLVEMMSVKKDYKGCGICAMYQIERILDKNDFDNIDSKDYDSLEEAIDKVDDCYGIKELEFNKEE